MCINRYEINCIDQQTGEIFNATLFQKDSKNKITLSMAKCENLNSNTQYKIKSFSYNLRNEVKIDERDFYTGKIYQNLLSDYGKILF
jgi:hypothetical protein